MKELQTYRNDICVLESIHSRITEKMPKVYYDQIKNYILSLLRSAGEITFYDLLAGAEKDEHLATIGRNLNWYLLKVKQDLEAKRIIRAKKSAGSNGVQLIILRKAQ